MLKCERICIESFAESFTFFYLGMFFAYRQLWCDFSWELLDILSFLMFSFAISTVKHMVPKVVPSFLSMRHCSTHLAVSWARIGTWKVPCCWFMRYVWRDFTFQVDSLWAQDLYVLFLLALSFRFQWIYIKDGVVLGKGNKHPFTIMLFSVFKVCCW